MALSTEPVIDQYPSFRFRLRTTVKYNFSKSPSYLDNYRKHFCTAMCFAILLIMTEHNHANV